MRGQSISKTRASSLGMERGQAGGMRTKVARQLTLSLLVLLFVLAVARLARAQVPGPPGEADAFPGSLGFGADDARLEELFHDGELDEEDLARLTSSTAGTGTGQTPPGASTLLAESWVSLVGFSRDLPTGIRDVGGFLVVGVALDKILQGRAHQVSTRGSIGEDASPRALPSVPSVLLSARTRLAIDAPLARGAVRSAWRASGIEVNDTRIDEMISRSRLSVLLPETRLRVVQMLQDGEHTTSYVNTAGTIIDTSGSTTTLEARLTWRLDRLLFAGDEPTLERVRLEREEARTRIGGRVLELLFAWQRALLDEAASDGGSRAEVEAALRQSEAEISLDVMTAGWFGAQPVVRAQRGTSALRGPGSTPAGAPSGG
jgi:hypothetical protein